MLVTLTLVVGELTDAGQRRWWAVRPLTTDTVAGLLVLLVTVLVVNQLLNRRQARQRGHAVAAQAAIMVAQATRSAQAVSAMTDGSGDRGTASDGLRTYMVMLLTGAPRGDRQVAGRCRRAERRVGRRGAAARKCRRTASPAAQSRDARFDPAHRPNPRSVGVGRRRYLGPDRTSHHQPGRGSRVHGLGCL
jgi:hypothetical protein